MAERLSLFLRHAGRGGLHQRTTPRAMRKSYRDALEAIARAQSEGRPRDLRAAQHLGEALRAASALRMGQARARDARIAAGRSSRSARGRAPPIIALTIDAEEAERLDLMLDVFEALGEAPELRGWNGLGLAVQAYQKRALPVLAWLIDLARRQGRRIPVRLVKGAYWDTEIKRGQEQGLADYPVFTRKAATDTSYLACARAMLAAQRRDLSAIRHPQRAHAGGHRRASPAAAATSNSSACTAWARRCTRFYRDIRKGVGDAHLCAGRQPRRSARLSRAPPARERRQHVLRQPSRRRRRAARRHHRRSGGAACASEPRCAIRAFRCRRTCCRDRKNSSGFVWSDPAISEPMIAAMQTALATPQTAGPIVGRQRDGTASRMPSSIRPIARASIGDGRRSRREADVDRCARCGARARSATGTRWAARRAPTILERAADLFEAQQRASDGARGARGGQDAAQRARRSARGGRFPALLRVAGARRSSRSRIALPGPTGESNELSLHGRGVVRLHQRRGISRSRSSPARSPARSRPATRVLAKPAEQTPLIAAAAVQAAASRPACRRMCCICCPATARRSAMRCSPTRASPASPSPARPKRRSRSTARSPRATARSPR